TRRAREKHGERDDGGAMERVHESSARLAARVVRTPHENSRVPRRRRANGRAARCSTGDDDDTPLGSSKVSFSHGSSPRPSRSPRASERRAGSWARPSRSQESAKSERARELKKRPRNFSGGSQRNTTPGSCKVSFSHGSWTRPPRSPRVREPRVSA